MRRVIVNDEPRYRLREFSKPPSRYGDFDSPIKPSPTKERNSKHSAASHSPTPKKLSTLATKRAPKRRSIKSEPLPTSDFAEIMAVVSTEQHSRQQHQQPPESTSGDGTQQQLYKIPGTNVEVSNESWRNVQRLKNFLLLPRAQLFIFCEFFYSDVDQQLLLAENEFSMLVSELFPSLQSRQLRKPEWREIRRLIGKPRRLSQNFLLEEREALEIKRQKIRLLYNGKFNILENDPSDLPRRLPRPPIIGQVVYTRVKSPIDGLSGLYRGKIEGVYDDGYQVVFDRNREIRPRFVKDFEIMSDQAPEMVSIDYFLPSFQNSELNNFGEITTMKEDSTASDKQKIGKDKKVGNFPVRLLVVIVKLAKLVDYKKQLVDSLGIMNNAAEKMILFDDKYPPEFKIKFSEIVVDLEIVNKLIKTYFLALHGYFLQILPHLNEPRPSDEPEDLKRACDNEAFEVVKQCNSQVNVRSDNVLNLITSLTSILLQIRTLSENRGRIGAYESNLVKQYFESIKSRIIFKNLSTFQEVELHMKQILKMMVSKT